VFAFTGNGVVGDNIVNVLTKLLHDNTIAITIYTAILILVGIGLRILLKRIPTTMQGIVSIILWKVAAVLFGDGILLQNNTDPIFVKNELIKKYPLLQIKIK
jgi:hypothetical protein